MGEGRQVKRGKDLIVERKTKGALLQKMIVTAHDQPNGGDACGLLHGLVMSLLIRYVHIPFYFRFSFAFSTSPIHHYAPLL